MEWGERMDSFVFLKEVVSFEFVAATITGDFTVSVTWSGRTADPNDGCFNQGYIEGRLGCSPFAKTPAFVPANAACTPSDRDGFMRAVGQYFEQHGIIKSQMVREVHTFDMLLGNGKKFNVYFIWDIRHEGWLHGCWDHLVSEPLPDVDIKRRDVLLERVKGYVEAVYRSELREKASAEYLKEWFDMRNAIKR